MPQSLNYNRTELLTGLPKLAFFNEPVSFASPSNDKADLRVAADRLLKERKWDQALRAWQSLYQEDPKNIHTLITIADILLNKKQRSAAYAHYENVVKLYLAQGNVEEAISVLRRVGRKVKDDFKPRERLVHLLMQVSAKTESDFLKNRYRNDALVELRVMAQEAEAKGHPKTLRYLRYVVDLDYRDLRTTRQIVKVLCSKERFGEAMSFLRQQILRLLEKRLITPAERLIMEALKLDNGNPGMKALYFYAQVRDGLVQAGLEGLERLQSHHPENTDVLDTLSLVERDRDNEAKSLHWAIKAFEVDPSRTAQMVALGEQFFEQGKNGLVFKVYKALSDSAIASGNPEGGIKIMEELYRKDPNSVACLRLLVVLNFRLERVEAGRYFLDRSIELFRRFNRTSECAQFIEDCLVELPGNPELTSLLERFSKK